MSKKNLIAVLNCTVTHNPGRKKPTFTFIFREESKVEMVKLGPSFVKVDKDERKSSTTLVSFIPTMDPKKGYKVQAKSPKSGAGTLVPFDEYAEHVDRIEIEVLEETLGEEKAAWLKDQISAYKTLHGSRKVLPLSVHLCETRLQVRTEREAFRSAR